jgi:hypothetical protein
MARCFFNKFDGQYKADDRGLDLPTLENARLEEKQLVLFTVIVIGVDASAGGQSLNPALSKPSA